MQFHSSKIYIVTSLVIGLAVISFANVANSAKAVLPKIEGTNQSGFAGFITKVTPCVCGTRGVLITAGGSFGGDYIFSFSNPPKIQVGQFFKISGPIIGSAGGSASCGTDLSHGDCRGKKNGKIITSIGGSSK
jgi:hypothetical protein